MQLSRPTAKHDDGVLLMVPAVSGMSYFLRISSVKADALSPILASWAVSDSRAGFAPARCDGGTHFCGFFSDAIVVDSLLRRDQGLFTKLQKWVALRTKQSRKS